MFFVCQVYEFHEFYFHIFRRNATVKKNCGGVRGNRQIPSAQRLLTPAPAAEEMEMTSGRHIISLWTQISSIHVERRQAKRIKRHKILPEILEL